MWHSVARPKLSATGPSAILRWSERTPTTSVLGQRSVMESRAPTPVETWARPDGRRPKQGPETWYQSIKTPKTLETWPEWGDIFELTPFKWHLVLSKWGHKMRYDGQTWSDWVTARSASWWTVEGEERGGEEDCPKRRSVLGHSVMSMEYGIWIASYQCLLCAR